MNYNLLCYKHVTRVVVGHQHITALKKDNPGGSILKFIRRCNGVDGPVGWIGESVFMDCLLLQKIKNQNLAKIQWLSEQSKIWIHTLK